MLVEAKFQLLFLFNYSQYKFLYFFFFQCKYSFCIFQNDTLLVIGPIIFIKADWCIYSFAQASSQTRAGRLIVKCLDHSDTRRSQLFIITKIPRIERKKFQVFFRVEINGCINFWRKKHSVNSVHNWCFYFCLHQFLLYQHFEFLL